MSNNEQLTPITDVLDEMLNMAVLGLSADEVMGLLEGLKDHVQKRINANRVISPATVEELDAILNAPEPKVEVLADGSCSPTS